MEREDRGSRTAEARARRRCADNDGKGFESFHVKDPDGFDLQIGNGNGLREASQGVAVEREAVASRCRLSRPDGRPSGWITSRSAPANYKASASFYRNLLGWKPTYDEGSQHELMIGDVGDIIIRGGNPLDPDGGQGDAARAAASTTSRSASQPWDTDGVKAELEKRGLKAQIDTSSRHKGPDGTWVPDEIHTARSRATTPTRRTGTTCRSATSRTTTGWRLPNAVRPKPGDAR